MVLLLCMIFLTAMMLLGLSASADTILQQQLAANLQKAEQVKQSAQTALETAEKWLLGLDKPAPDACQAPCSQALIHPAGTLPADLQYKPLAWWLAHGQAGDQNPSTSKDTGSPSVWLVELAYSITVADRPDERRSWYRVVARGSDPADTVVSVVESIVLKTWKDGENPPAEKSTIAASCTPGSGDCGRQAWRRLR